MSRRTLRVAGVGYTVVWCLGLAVFGSSTSVSSTGRDLLEQYAGHSSALALQFLLTQGLAALLLGIVLVGWTAVTTGAHRTLIGWAGGAAVTVSLLQCALGLALALIAVPVRDPDDVGALAATLNHLDGAKMLLLAIVLGCVAHGGHVSRPDWSGALCAAATVTLVVSAVGYGFLADLPAMAAFLSLPLLLASVTVGAFVVGPVPEGDARTRRSPSSETVSELEPGARRT